MAMIGQAVVCIEPACDGWDQGGTLPLHQGMRGLRVASNGPLRYGLYLAFVFTVLSL